MRLSEFLREGREWLRDLRQDPRLLAQRVEELNPEIARRLLNYASELSEWPLWGMGLEIREWSDERIWVELPNRRKNRLSSGEISLGVLTALGEFAVRGLIGRHLGAGMGSLELTRCELSLSRPIAETVWARLEIKQSEREGWLSEMAREGETLPELNVALLTTQGLRIGELLVTCKIVRAKALPPRS